MTKTFIALLFVLFFALPALAMDSSTPDRLVRDIYSYYTVPGKGVPMRTHKQLAAVFTHDLARLVETDRRHARGNAPQLVGDPFVGAQEWELSHVRISLEDNGPALSTAFVNFENGGRDTEVTLSLVREKTGWRVNEVVSPSGSLRQLLTSPR